MKILVYSANFAPEPTGIGKYSGEMCAWLSARGHRVRAVAAPPYYPSWTLDPSYARPAYRQEKWQGVHIWRAPIWVPKSPSGLTRVLHLLSFAISSFPVILRQAFWAPDVVIVVAPALVCAPAALITARLCGAQAWLHMQDFEIDIAFRMNMLRGSLFQRIVLRLEKWLLGRFDVVSSISARMAERLLLKGVKPDKIRYFPNWVDVVHIDPARNSVDLRAQWGLPVDACIALFSGSLGGKQGLTIIPEVARRLAERKDILFLICGDGIMKHELEVASADLDNVRFLALQPFEKLGALLCMADLHLLPQSADAADLVLPSKLSGMLASGRPVIATCRSGTELHTVVSQCGIAVPPLDASALASAVECLADDRVLRLSLGRKARSYAELNFERDAILERVFAVDAEEDSEVPDDVPA